MFGSHPSQTGSAPFGVLIVDDSPDLAAMVARLLGAQPDMQVVGVLHDASALADRIAELRPRVLLLDLTMPGVQPLDALRAAAPTCEKAGTRTIAFSGHDDPDTEAMAKAAGAMRLLSKGEAPEAIIAAVRSVGSGRGA